MSKNTYNLTNPQKSIWLSEQTYGNTNINTICGTIFFKENVDIELLKETVNIFIQKNDALRTRIIVDGKEPKQFISDVTSYEPKAFELNSIEELNKLESNVAKTTFNLLDSDLFLFKVFKLKNGTGGIIGHLHHLISDAWSFGIMSKQLKDIYEKLLSKEEFDVAPSYVEFIEKESEYIASDKFIKNKEYWENTFSEVPDLASIKYYQNDNNTTEAQRYKAELNLKLCKTINEYARENKTSAYSFLMSIYSLYLSRVSNIDNVVIGTPFLNRSNFKEKNMMGMFVNTLPNKLDIDWNISFSEFVKYTTEQQRNMFRHSKYPYDKLLEQIRKDQHISRNLYDILISYQNARNDSQESNIDYYTYWNFNGNIPESMQIHVYDMDNTGALQVFYDYQTCKFTEEEVKEIHNRILYIIEQVLEKDISLKEIEIVTPDEKRKILYDFNDTKADYPKDKTITQLFEEQVEKTPDNIAVVFEDQNLTYRELNERANSLAHFLRNNDIQRNDIVGIMVNRSLEMIISILAVLKSGACYIPIDPEYPQDRIEYMLNNSDAKMLLTFQTLDTKVNFNNKVFVELNNELYNSNKDNLKNINKPDDLSYIIYTSGSTGMPKGVMLTHKNVNNFITGMSNIIDFSNKKSIVSVTTISFDIFVLETLLPLQKGLKIVIANENEQINVNLFNKLCITNNVNIIQTTPSRFQFLISDNKELDYLNNITDILIGGESFPKTLLKKLKELSHANIYNVYGPTETTVWSTIKDLTNSLDIKIGKPISNTTCYILDKNKNLLPTQVPGNLYIGGAGIAAGYYKNDSLTSEKFIKNKYLNETIYETGDLAYFTTEGELIHLGRTDFQVKVNGHRIELEEIENQIMTIPEIDKCVVTKKVLSDNHEFLCAYIVSSSDINSNDIRNYLIKTLPIYMIPQYFIKLENLPYTPNGKINRKKLPVPNLNDNDKQVVLPRNDMDRILINILKDLLQIKNISIENSFFEIGGDSLTAINLCTQIYSKFNIQLFVKDILENPIIKDLSDLISNYNPSDISNIKLTKADKSNYYPLSSAQKRTYYSTKKISENNLVYNVSGALLVDKLLDVTKIKNAFSKILQLHSSFRTRFILNGEELVQEILDIKNLDIEVFDGHEKDLNKIINKFPKPFDLSKAPLLRVSVCILDNKKTLILLDSHHIIIDGVSLNILMRDFCKLYNDEAVQEPDFKYIDYSVWENNYINSEEIKEYEKYWSSVCSNTDIPVLNLPYDYPVTNSKSYNGDRISHTMQREMFEKLQNLAKSSNISEYTLFLTALYIVLYKYTSQTDLIVASPLAGRNFEEISNVIGMFVNNIILRKNLEVNDSVSDLLKSVQHTVTNSLSNQPYPYELVAKKLNNNPSLLDVVLTYQNTKKDEYKIEDSKLELISADTKTSKFNIWLEIIPDMFTFNLEYNSNLFKKETIESFLNHYMFILDQMLDNIDSKVEDLKILTKTDLDMLDKFNHTDGPINDDTVVSIFEEQVNKNPNNIAIICEDKTLTYDELNKKANSLAHHLIEKGIKANDIVCIMTNRSFETIVCMMAILKAGAAFFNVDPTYPIERTKYYLEDSKTRYVLTQKELKDRVESIENCIEIDLNIDDIYNKNFDNPNLKIGLQDLSYLIYTSGSTGKPKGTMLNHVGFANMVKAMTLVLDYLKEGNKHCIASVTSTPFDIFVYEIIVSLTHGLKIAMANNAEHRNPKLLDALIRKCNVDVMTVTPSLMKINYDNREPDTALARVKNMVFGGEPLPEKFVQDLKALANDITVYNIYGPSEITILSNVQNLDGETEITTGPPIMNTQIHILDKNMKRVPVGVVGEIYISGIQVGLGYIGKPELTAEKFLDNPFGEGKMYKSGDIGRWTFDGKVQCLGRIDHQIKLRGLRIELGEIENVMLNIEGVTSAVVNKIEIDGNEFLCGYYVADNNVKDDIVKDTLRKALPPYMVPTYFVKLDKMPYTINRKIDRKALPMPEFNKPIVNSKVNIEELNSNEEKLLQIWKNILKIEDIDINDNFFDIGGDSVAAISMQIEAVKYGLDFEYSDIFTHPTIKELSKKSNRSDEEFIKNYDYKKLKEVLSRNNIDNLKTIKKSKIKNILLIGATGYLGAHILDSFMKNNKGTIYCLVRPKNNINIEKRLKDMLTFYFGNKYEKEFSHRIKVIHGDIVENNLGLSDKDFKLLSDNIDAVINSGALVKHFGIKKKFEEINVTGTQNVIDFCKQTNKRLLHISTISISGNGEKEETVIETPENINKKKLFKETDIYVGQDIKGVYSTTKFRAELLVLEAILDGLDAQILRLGNITNRYSDGVFQMNVDENAFAKRIKSFIEMGAFPKYLLQHAIELTPVDLATEAIIKILNHKSYCNIFHIYDTKLLPIKLLIETFTNNLNIDILPVSDIMMKDILTGILSDNTRKDILSGIIYDLDDNKNLIYTSNIRLNSDFTEKYLNKLGFKWKNIDKEYIIRYMKYFNNINFINGGNK